MFPDQRAAETILVSVAEGKIVKNRLHLDLLVGGGHGVPLAQRRERVGVKVKSLALAGATVVHTHDTPEHDHYSVLLQDPEGNEFCVV